jgi:hypothetical protein
VGLLRKVFGTDSKFELRQVVGKALPSYVEGVCINEKVTNIYQGLNIVTDITLI